MAQVSEKPTFLTRNQALAAVGRVIRVVERWETASRVIEDAPSTATAAYAAEIREALTVERTT